LAPGFCHHVIFGVDRIVFFHLPCILWWRVEAKYNSLPRLEILNSSNVLAYAVSQLPKSATQIQDFLYEDRK